MVTLSFKENEIRLIVEAYNHYPPTGTFLLINRHEMLSLLIKIWKQTTKELKKVLKPIIKEFFDKFGFLFHPGMPSFLAPKVKKK